MKKFIKETLELDTDVVDLEGYEKKHKTYLDEILQFADDFDIAINMGTSEDNTYLCEYRIVGNTIQFCNGLLSELKQILKEGFPKTKSLFKASGNVLF